jgi:hypothetical protein
MELSIWLATSTQSFSFPPILLNPKAAIMRRIFRAAPLAPASRTFFGKGWDNAALDTVYKAVVRKPEVTSKLRTGLAESMDSRTLEATRAIESKSLAANQAVTIFLPPHLGDPHRLLKAYSLTAYPILDEKGEQLCVELDGQEVVAFADPDDDFAKVVIPSLPTVEFLAQELLKTLNWETTPRGAASLLESLYRGAEIPDHVFQTEAVIERI